jgi:sulfate adenylyltransferase subunit 1
MVTGASTAELAVVLVDARNGVVEQTRRHAAVAALLRVPHVVLAVNKMDLVGYDEGVFAEVANVFGAYATALGVPDVTAIPISALRGDNVVEPSAEMDWYPGPTLLEHLENVPVGRDPSTEPARFPVQYVLRPQTEAHRDYRGYAGQVVSGELYAGEEVVVLPSGLRTTIEGIDRLGEQVAAAVAGESATLRLTDDLDVSRGDLIVPATAHLPTVGQDLDATLCWLADRPLRPGDRVLLKHTTRVVKAIVREISHRLDIETLDRHDRPETLSSNEIGQAVLRTAAPLAYDRYSENRRTGSFLLVDDHDGATLAAGMIGDPLASDSASGRS